MCRRWTWVLLLGLINAIMTVQVARAADWPMWRHDAGRGASSPQQLPDKLHVHWVHALPPLKPAWPDQPRMQFDAAYEPIVVGKMLYFGSSRNDCVTALDTRTGAQVWRTFLDGPVRFAPAAWQDRLFVACDDGCLHCLDAASGKQLWKFRGGPSDRKILGNERLISTWPARGAPVLAGDTVYFAASIWPFMGTFIHALDARTGKVRWTNDGDGSLFIKQPHYADSFAGVAPQGHLVVQGDRLLIPGGRSVPAVYDRHTGKLLQFLLAENGRRGGHEVAGCGGYFACAGSIFDLKTAKHRGDLAELVAVGAAKSTASAGERLRLAVDGNMLYTHVAGACRAFDLTTADDKTVESVDRKGNSILVSHWGMDEIASCPVPVMHDLIKAGSRLYAASEDNILAIDLNEKKGKVLWSSNLQGAVCRLLAADDRLFAVTLEGRIYCLGGVEADTKIQSAKPRVTENGGVSREWARNILDSTGVRTGYAIVWGAAAADVIELARQSELHLIVVDPDADRIQSLRERLVAEGLYGSRVAAHQGHPESFELPPYLASLTVLADGQLVNKQNATAVIKKLFQTMRPYGGQTCFASGPSEELRIKISELAGELPNARVVDAGGLTILVREGELPGAGSWTHEHADAANTRVSRDRLIKAPMGVLWFGGPGNPGVLPRHGHGPQPQVLDGRLFIEGVDFFRCLDIYTGRLLWQVELPGVGAFFNNLAHQPGANSSGTNHIAMPDGIYVAQQKSCLKLDPATGKTLAEFKLPLLGDMAEPPRWGYLNVAGDYLVAGAEPLLTKPAIEKKKAADDDDHDEGALAKLLAKINRSSPDNLSSSKYLVVMNRHTGKVLWSMTARDGFRHNGTCIGGDRLYTVDRLSGAQLAQFKRRGEDPPHEPRLLALDLKTGKMLWSTEQDVFGTWLSYSAKHDVLLEAGRVARDTVSDEPRGMRAYQAGDGKMLWYEKSHVGPAMIHGDTILQGQGACDLLTGKVKTRTDPISGLSVPWEWLRAYGCNTPAASEHLLTFRSGAAGFFDLRGDGGTGNLGGFRTGCTNNLIVAGGLLCAPEYTRTCTCSYQNQSSLALVHMPEAELWTYFGTKKLHGPIARLGINLGAAGDRRADDGTLWLEYPSTGGYSPAVGVKTTPAEPEWFRRHSSRVPGKHNWITSSGVRGLESLTLSMNSSAEHARKVTVRLYFVEPDDKKPGERVLDVFVQDRKVAADLDVVREAGGKDRSLVKEFSGIEVEDTLVVRLAPSPACPEAVTILCGVEIVAEDSE